MDGHGYRKKFISIYQPRSVVKKKEEWIRHLTKGQRHSHAA